MQSGKSIEERPSDHLSISFFSNFKAKPFGHVPSSRQALLPWQEARKAPPRLNHQAVQCYSHTLNNYTYVLFQVCIKQTRCRLLNKTPWKLWFLFSCSALQEQNVNNFNTVNTEEIYYASFVFFLKKTNYISSLMFHLTVTTAANVCGILPSIVRSVLAFVERLKLAILEFPQCDCLHLVPFLDATPGLFFLQNTKTPVLKLRWKRTVSSES